MELRRCEPSSTCDRDVADLSTGANTHRKGRSPVPGTDAAQAGDQLFLVGQSRGRAGPKYLSGRVPGPGQHWCLRSIATASDGWNDQPIGWNCMDGDVCAEP